MNVVQDPLVRTVDLGPSLWSTRPRGVLVPFPRIAAGVPTAIVSGAAKILELQGVLAERSVAFEQAGAMDHLAYFLGWASALRKTPHLVLLGATRKEAVRHPEKLQGALLLFEYKLRGRGTHIFATDDTTGRRTLLAPPEQRAAMAKLGAEALMQGGAGVVLISFAQPQGEPLAGFDDCAGSTVRRPRRWRVAMRRREIPGYLPLETTFDATLAKMGQKTRANLRYYRKRAESQLGANFVPSVEIARQDFLDFNRTCTYAVPEALAAWRFAAISSTPGMFVAGVRGGDGRWLSLVGARRFHGMVEIDWQMNRQDLPAASLVTVMRAFLIEHEVEAGMRRLYIEGGTPHAMQHSFATEAVRDLLVLRRGIIAPIVRKVGGRLAPKTNFVVEMLSDRSLIWQNWR